MKKLITKYMALSNLVLFISFIFMVQASQAFAEDNSVCARVKIEIKQELTLERQAFDAHMRINNGLTNIALQNVSIDVNFADESGNPVRATSDPDDITAQFFIRLDSMENINNVQGLGSVQPSTSADIHWLIIPAPGSSNGLEQGTLYYVGATLRYTIGGDEHVTEVTPDYIFVKPMPMLTLDYFLPIDVFGDDPFTPEIEPVIPFNLGVRVKNTGHGAAKNLKIDSAQPKIVENELGLLINFLIVGSEVNGQPETNSLLVDFGSIAPDTSGIARWIMTCTLYGKFVEFTAEFSHADELGGELTSLIDAVNTHFLIRDVLVDLAGRDAIRDFLGKDGDVYRVYESDSVEADAADLSSSASLQFASQSGPDFYYTLAAPSTIGFMYAKLTDPFGGQKAIKEVVRSDGKRLKMDNAWLSRTRVKAGPWQYFFNLFDVNTTDSYTVVFSGPEGGSHAPVIQFIPDKTRLEGEQVSFLVEASDPDGTIPTLRTSSLPVGAVFTDQGNIGNGIATGIFDWTPAAGQAGRYEITYTASDGVLESTRRAVITVNSPVDTDGDGVLNVSDNCVNDANPDQSDLDSDGTGDACDECVSDPAKILSGLCGCGTADTDADNDNVVDCRDKCPETPEGELVDADGCAESQRNHKPVADAGADRNAVTGLPVTLDGSGSHDQDDDMIGFRWSFLQVPAGSSISDASLSDMSSAKPEFTPDVNGIYRLQLIVNDSMADSTADEVLIASAVSNVAPNADAGPDRNAKTGDLVSLDAGRSSDPDHGPQSLAYLWSFGLVPPSSTLTDSDIAERDKVSASFTPDAEGAYQLKLTVNDSQLADEDTVQINASFFDVTPNSDAGDDQHIWLGDTAALDGSASNDPDSSPQPLLFNWKFVAVPTGSVITDLDLIGANTVTPFFIPDRKGTYVLKLNVYDGKFSDSDNYAVTAYEDMDNDGVTDDRDNCKHVYNPGQTDTDGDTVGDACDNCRSVPNPDQRDDNDPEDDNKSKEGVQHYGDACDPDFDNDGLVSLTDYAEWRKYYRQSVPPAPSYIDLDNDGIVGLSDYAIWRKYYRNVPGPGYDDLDDDGYAAPADCDDGNNMVYPGAADIPNNGVDEDCSGSDFIDTDLDGVEDESDNCLNIANSDQLDVDSDGAGDACDNCRLVANPDQTDDNSGEDDNTSVSGTQHYGDVCDPDFDNDGLVTLTDYATWRKYYRQDTATAPLFVDLDGDNLVGLSDYAIWRKYYRGTPGN